MKSDSTGVFPDKVVYDHGGAMPLGTYEITIEDEWEEVLEELGYVIRGKTQVWRLIHDNS